MKTIKLLTFVGLIAIFFNSCSKGDTGATGPQGPSGQNGVSNLTISTYTVPTGSWSNYNSTTWDYVTGSSISTTDVVIVYISLNGTTYTQIPISSFFYGGDLITFVFGSTGNVTLWDYFSSSSPDATIYVKVADIPPSIYVKYPNTNWKNYMEVAQLPEAHSILNR